MTYRIDEKLGLVSNNSTSTSDQTTEIFALQSSTAALQAATSCVTYDAAGAIAPTGIAVLKAGSAAAMTLVVPPAGATLTIVAADAEAYTVTTPANKLNGADDTMTWTAAVGNSVQLVSAAGVWYVVLNTGVALSEA